MKMSELISKLEKDMELFGDIEVGVDYRMKVAPMEDMIPK